MWGQTLMRKPGSPDSPPENICVMRLSAIGDVCHAVAAVQHIQRHWPSTNITWIVGRTEYDLLRGLKGVEFILFNKSDGIKGLLHLRRQLHGRVFDVLLHMQSSLRASLASACVRAKKRIGFDGARAREGQWLFTNARISAQKHPHVLEGFMAFATALGLPEAPPRWQMPIDPVYDEWAVSRFRSLKPYVVICPSASNPERNWLPERYAETADLLSKRGYRVVLCGSALASERVLANQVLELSKGELVDLVGNTNLKQLLAVLKHAELVISPDTGPAHMAVTVGTPVIGLYAHSNPRRTGPYNYIDQVVSVYDEAILEQYGLSWEKLPSGKRAVGDHLMQRIKVDDVMAKIDVVLRKHYPHVV